MKADEIVVTTVFELTEYLNREWQAAYDCKEEIQMLCGNFDYTKIDSFTSFYLVTGKKKAYEHINRYLNVYYGSDEMTDDKILSMVFRYLKKCLKKQYGKCFALYLEVHESCPLPIGLYKRDYIEAGKFLAYESLYYFFTRRTSIGCVVSSVKKSDKEIFS